QVVAEVETEDQELAVSGGEGEAGGIEVDHRRSARGERGEGRLERIDHRLRRGHERIEAAQPAAGEAQPRALQPGGIEELGVVGRDVLRTRPAGDALPAERNAAGCRIATVE